MDPFKDKYFVFIVSGGRTGTRFLGETLSKVIDNSFSVHEPDVFVPRRGFSDFWKKIKVFGLYQIFLGKILQTTGIRNLSQNYLSGKYNLEDVQQSLIAQRRKYYESIDKELIIESYGGWYGCIPAIRSLYANYRIIVLPRNPKSWATSVMNRSALFGRLDLVTLSGLGRLTPALIGDDEYKQKWRHFNRFQRVCWTYKTQYETMVREVQGDENSRVTKFEDLFESRDRYDNLCNLLEFTTTFNDKKFECSVPADILEKKIHETSSFDFPSPDSWDDELLKQYQQISGSIAARLGY